MQWHGRQHLVRMHIHGIHTETWPFNTYITQQGGVMNEWMNERVTVSVVKKYLDLCFSLCLVVWKLILFWTLIEMVSGLGHLYLPNNSLLIGHGKCLFRYFGSPLFSFKVNIIIPTCYPISIGKSANIMVHHCYNDLAGSCKYILV